jgi:hypothetical protein
MNAILGVCMVLFGVIVGLVVKQSNRPEEKTAYLLVVGPGTSKAGADQLEANMVRMGVLGRVCFCVDVSGAPVQYEFKVKA